MTQIQCALLNVTPIDGRYTEQTRHVAQYFSEFSLIQTRIEVEVKYYHELLSFLQEHEKLEIPQERSHDLNRLTRFYQSFDPQQAQEIKEIEQTTNHDVKAVEYYLRNHFPPKLPKNYIHFALTSQDINNPSTTLLLKRYQENQLFPQLQYLITHLTQNFVTPYQQTPMLARTHGQPATPTTLGKEFQVYTHRLQLQFESYQKLPHYTKFGGASGTLHAHYSAYPDLDWLEFADQFIHHLDQSNQQTFNLPEQQQKQKNSNNPIKRYQYTTQIDPYDNLSEHLHSLKRISQILIDLCQDVWLYISQNYFIQEVDKDEVGSSAMPHKVNPINFENAEANLQITTMWCEFMSRKLTTSRLQRDLTDSTTLRNLGQPFANFQIALNSLQKGLCKISLNLRKIEEDLYDHSIVLSEAVQTILRTIPPKELPQELENPYDFMKKITRTDQHPTQLNFHYLILELDKLGVSTEILEKITSIKYLPNQPNKNLN